MFSENFWGIAVPVGYWLLEFLFIIVLIMIILALYKYIKNH